MPTIDQLEEKGNQLKPYINYFHDHFHWLPSANLVNLKRGNRMKTKSLLQGLAANLERMKKKLKLDLGAVHILRNTNLGSRETPPTPHCNIVINQEDPPPMLYCNKFG